MRNDVIKEAMRMMALSIYNLEGRTLEEFEESTWGTMGHDLSQGVAREGFKALCVGKEPLRERSSSFRDEAEIYFG